MLIAGIHSGHGCSYCILENGIPILHAELERYIREKEPFGDGLGLLMKDFPDYHKIDYFTHSACTWKGGIQVRHPKTYKEMYRIINKNNGDFVVPGHHEAHAAAAFFSSNLPHALILTIDGGGREYAGDDLQTATFGIWLGEENKIEYTELALDIQINIGVFWSTMTKDVFGLSVGTPIGHQAGTVMAMAALGDPSLYGQEIFDGRMMPWNFDFDRYIRIAKEGEQSKFDIAAGLQWATEQTIANFLEAALKNFPDTRNLCLSGGVVLNSVLVGKLLEWFNFDNIFVDPVPYDSGLAIGAAQWVWHHYLGNPRIRAEYTPYLGKEYPRGDVLRAIDDAGLSYTKVSDEDVLGLLDKQKIVSVFGGKSESGRRALGNRSILADPRQKEMKDKINEKVKHRVWFRPFAPSILREEVTNWFVQDVDSPYMSFCIKFRDDRKNQVPAVVHADGTARLQTVTEKSNHWYYNFIKKWHKRTGVPMLLNTSFNDREPIVETPEDAIACYLKTDIDNLYFFEHKVLLSK